ncbi:asparagine synthase (glutamine-hydrolyzing) [Patescibacteria group bacterium]|nr:asparagine synthase (glutamine-hydrolyzing) [Patescibacteria group bacterium]MBP9709711.1 asparagine synthase (glutamine-hydrolyzing) [Patescibacteria group bacterium]
MCGIAGYVGQGTRAELEQAARAILRRGPDDEGFYEGRGVGFAFRRLSIIDITHGHQPLSNQEETIWAMLNGEIYNFQRLREELRALGCSFTTNTDTEVIVHGYAVWGQAVFSRLEGMFAIAIWDTRTHTLCLARDRLGKKPLYYTQWTGTVWFASELKALVAADIFHKELDLTALATYFRTDAVPTPDSIWKGVRKLPPASFLVISEGNMGEITPFWRLDPTSFPAVDSSKQAIASLRTSIDAAVKDRLVADVPLGLFLSGGLDSAVVAASAVRQSSQRLRAFTIGFDDPSHDETAAAKSIAQALCLEHHVAKLSQKDALDMLDEAVECVDEPLADAAILPQLLLARFAKKYLTVALAGDGGDELLYGYQHIPLHTFAMRHPQLWSSLGIGKKLLAHVPAGQGYFSPGFKVQRTARGLGETELWKRDVAWRGAVTASDTLSLFSPAVREGLHISVAEERLTAYEEEVSAWASPWQGWSWGYLRSFLMDEVMVKVDRATMWFGIEGRSPLLDHRVVETAFAIPDHYKLSEWRGKRLFREMLEGVIPESILKQPKHGFGVPTAAWLRGPLRDRLEAVSQPAFLLKQGLFEAKTVNRWKEEHKQGRPDRRKELWAFLMFQLWYARWH